MKSLFVNGIISILVFVLLIINGAYFVGQTEALEKSSPTPTPTEIITHPSKKVLNKIDDNKPVTAKEAARKIMYISYNELDDFIKKYSQNDCPKVRVNFILDNDTQVVFSPLCEYPNAWRTVRFDFKDGTSRITVLDGPMTGEPGTLNQEAMNQSINVLVDELIKSNMIVKVSKWSDRYDLNTQAGLDQLTKFIYNSISSFQL